MADVLGRTAKLAVSAVGVTYTPVGGVKDVSNPHSRGTIEVTDNDSAGWKESLNGIGSFTVSVTMNYNEADAGQVIIYTANEAPAALYFRYRPKGDDVGVSKEFIFKANITSVEAGSAVDGAAELTLEAEGTGALTHQVQA
jgi:predicted secreted protein